MNGKTEPCGGYGVRGLAYDHNRKQCDCPDGKVLYGMRCLYVNPADTANNMMNGEMNNIILWTCIIFYVCSLLICRHSFIKEVTSYSLYAYKAGKIVERNWAGRFFLS